MAELRHTGRMLRALAVILVLAAPGTAWAQEDGVTVDPDSPTGKEYAIPLDSARRQAQAGTGSRESGADSEAPLFGQGVEAETASGGEDSDGGSSSGKSGGSGSDGSGNSSDGGDPSMGDSDALPREVAGDSLAAVQPGAPDGGSGTLLLAGGAALAVLLAGVLAGVLVRRRT